jgi:hypothetical protein
MYQDVKKVFARVYHSCSVLFVLNVLNILL